jgi:hypothetical protein
MEINDINVLPQMPPVKAVFDSRFFIGVLIVAAVTLIGYYAGRYFYGWGFGLCFDGVKCVVDLGETAAGTGLNLS